MKKLLLLCTILMFTITSPAQDIIPSMDYDMVTTLATNSAQTYRATATAWYSQQTINVPSYSYVAPSIPVTTNTQRINANSGVFYPPYTFNSYTTEGVNPTKDYIPIKYSINEDSHKRE